MRLYLLPFLALSLATACDDSEGTGPTQPLEAATVSASNTLRFSPASVEIVAGGKVTWVFGSVGHTVVFNNPQNAPAGISLTSSAQVERVFATTGTYAYHCSVHTNPPMTGTVVVR